MQDYARSVYNPVQRQTHGSAMIPFEVELIINRLNTNPHDLFLRELAGTRRIGLQPYYCEAWAIAGLVQGIKAPRPLTHSSYVETIGALGARIQDVFIHDVVDEIIHASLRIISAGRLFVVDVRASDAVALALTARAPILVLERLIERGKGVRNLL
jgi:uncharacterized protein